MNNPVPDIQLPSFLQKAQDVQSSCAPPIAPKNEVPKYSDFSEAIEKIWSQGKHEHVDAYRLGNRLMGLDPDAKYHDVIKIIIDILFNSVKEQVAKSLADSVDARQVALLQLGGIQRCIQSNLDLLKTFDFKVDKSILYALLSGYVVNATKSVITVKK